MRQLDLKNIPPPPDDSGFSNIKIPPPPDGSGISDEKNAIKILSEGYQKSLNAKDVKRDAFTPEFWNKLSADEQNLVNDKKVSGQWNAEDIKHAESVMRGEEPIQQSQKVGSVLRTHKGYYFDPADPKNLPHPIIDEKSIPVNADVKYAFGNQIENALDIAPKIWDGLKKIGKGMIEMGSSTNMIPLTNPYTGIPVSQKAEDIKNAEKPYMKGKEFMHGALTATTGTTEAAFNIIPQAILFNTGLAATKEVLENDKVKVPYGKDISKGIDKVMAPASEIASLIGYNPEEDSNGKMALELGNLVAFVGLMKSPELLKKGKATISSIDDLKNISKQAEEGVLDRKVASDLKGYFDNVNTITPKEIRDAAIAKGTPESLEIANKLDYVAQQIDGVRNISINHKIGERDNVIYDHVKSGNSTILKTQLKTMYDNGEIDANDFHNAIIKTDAYKQYNQLTEGKSLPDADAKKVFDLSWKAENANHTIKAMEADESVKNSPIKQADLKNIKELHKNYVNDIADVFSGKKKEGVSEKAEKQPTAATRIPTPEENVWVAQNIADVRNELGINTPFEDVLAETRRRYSEAEAMPIVNAEPVVQPPVLEEQSKSTSPDVLKEESTSKYSEYTDSDLEKKWVESESAPFGTKESLEFNDIEKELIKRERNSVFNVSLSDAIVSLDKLKNRYKNYKTEGEPFIEKRDISESKSVVEKYSNPELISDSELMTDFSEALRGRPITWYADGLKLRESLKEASRRGIETKSLIKKVEDVYIQDGYSSETARDVVLGFLEPIFKDTKTNIVSDANALGSAKEKISESEKKATKIQQYKSDKNKILSSDPTTSKGFVLQHFLKGGKINIKDFARATGYKFSDMLPFRRYLDVKNEQTPLDNFFENAPEEMRTKFSGAMDEQNFVIETLLDHKNKGDMVESLLKEEVDSKNKDVQDINNIDPELIKAFEEQDKLNEENYNLTPSEIEALGKEYEASVPPDEVTPLSDKAQAFKELDEARKEFRKNGGLSSGGLQQTEAFVKVVKAAIKAGYYTAKEFVSKFGKEFKGYTEKEIGDAFDSIKTEHYPEKNSPEAYQMAYDLKKNKALKIKTSSAKLAKQVNNVASEFLAPISTALGNLHPTLKQAIRDFQRKFENSVRADNSKIQGYLEKSDAMKKKNPKDYSDFDTARKNNDTETINRLVKKYGMEKDDASRAKVLEDLYEKAKASGIDLGYRENYNPRLVKDSPGLLTFIKENASDKEWGTIQEAFRLKEESLKRPLTVDEKAELISAMTRGYKGGISLEKIGQFKERNIDYVTPEMEKYYYDSNTALIKYIENANKLIEKREFFGKSELMNGDIGLEGTVGFKLLQAFSKGEITLDQFKEAQPILESYFKDLSPAKPISIVNDIGYMDAMGDVTSSLTAIGEIGWSLYLSGLKSSVKNLGKAIAGKSDVKIHDIIKDDIMHEFGQISTFKNAVSTLFKYTGLTKMDRLGKETLINSYYDTLKKQAKGLDSMKPYDKKQFMDRLNSLYEPKDVEQTIKDLKAGKKSELVLNTIYNRVLDFTPVSKSEVPQAYLEHPNGRIAYSLKMYMLKQFDVYRNEVVKKLKSKNEGDRLEGAKRFSKMAASLAIVGMTTDELKDLILGRETQLSDRVSYGLMKLVNINPYNVGVANREGLASSMAKTVLPTTPFAVFDVISDVLSGSDKAVKHIPLVGKTIYSNTHTKNKKKK